jgi:hypothetical protein
MKRILLAFALLLGIGGVAHADGLLAPCTGLFCQGPATLTSNTPILGNGTGLPISGSRSGNTTTFATSTGTLTNGHCVSIDGSGNFVDAGGACTTGGGGGTVSSGTINQLGVYASTGTTISGLATANSGVLVTSGSGVPSISTTLPNGLALGTPGSVTLTNGTGLPIAGITGLGTGVGTWLATPSSANLAAAVTDETGSGALVFATSPTFVTPILGAASATTIDKVTITAPATNAILTIADGKTLTDTSAIGANLLLGATGGGFSAYAGVTCTNQFLRVLSAAGAGTCASVAIGSDVSGLGTGIATWLGTPSSANLAAAVTDETGTGSLVFGTAPTITLANGTGLPISTGVSGLGTGIGTWLATPSSANLATAVTDETGSGSLVFGTSPTLGGTIAGTPTWASGLNIATAQTYKINGTQITCAALSNAAASCSTDATNAGNISSGNLAAARFPATTSCSAQLRFGGANTGITYTQQVCNYVQFNKWTALQVDLTLSSKGSATGSATITNLPVTIASAGGDQPCSIVMLSTSTVTALLSNPQAEAVHATTTIALSNFNVALGTDPALRDTNFTATTTVEINCMVATD